MVESKKLGRGLESLLSKSLKVVTTAIPIPGLKKEPPSEASQQEVLPSKQEEIPSIPINRSEEDKGLIWLNIKDIIPNRFQPRKEFDPEGLKELTNSIKSTGVIQPIIVRRSGQNYELIAGERRWRACCELNISFIPAIIKEADDKTLLEWAIIENTQRQDLNPIERARAYQKLVDIFKLTHDEIADRLGVARPTISNFIRLLELPPEVQEEVSRGTISMGHARTLLSLSDPESQIKLVRRIKKEGMSVRRLEYVIRYLKRTKTKYPLSTREELYLKELEEKLRRKFGAKVSIISYKSRGYVMIHFNSPDDFQRILDVFNI